MLKEEAQRTASFEKIASRVKFSLKFSAKEIEERWKAMLYDPTISRDAAKGMISLPTNANKRVLWTVEEEQILKKEVKKIYFIEVFFKFTLIFFFIHMNFYFDFCVDC